MRMIKSPRGLVIKVQVLLRSSMFRVGLMWGMALSATHASAQDSSLAQSGPDVVVPVEIGIGTLNAEVQCGPPALRLPPTDVFEIRIINNAERPVMFVAPEFFGAAQILELNGSVFDAASGGLLVQPEDLVEVVLRTPPVGEYYYACFDPGEQPTPQSTGFLTVIPRT